MCASDSTGCWCQAKPATVVQVREQRPQRSTRAVASEEDTANSAVGSPLSPSPLPAAAGLLLAAPTWLAVLLQETPRSASARYRLAHGANGQEPYEQQNNSS